MTCYSPITAYRTNSVNPETGRRGITFGRGSGHVDMQIDIPCGKCIGCRTSKTSQWAVRCVHESMLHDRNCFLTLTYDPDRYRPKSLVKDDLLKFFKRLRNSKHFKRSGDISFRHFSCGEYGDNSGHAHFHSLIFGFDFDDKKLFKTTPHNLYTSSELESLWPFGFSTIGSVNYSTANYTARYAAEFHSLENWEELFPDLVRPYLTMSKRPAVGKRYFEKYRQQLLDTGYCVINGSKYPIPQYYKKLMTPAEIRYLEDRHGFFKSEMSLEKLRIKEFVKNESVKNYNRDIT